MPDVDINDLGGMGLIKDRPPYMLPPEAWSEALNVRFFNSGVERLQGWSQALGNPPISPHFIRPVISAAQSWVLYTSLTKGYVYDGSTHTDITRASGDYAAAGTEMWNGTILGGIPILNNGTDVPQFWADYSTAQLLQDLTNWPATMRTKVMRSLGPFLVAANLVDDGTPYPHRVLWSHPADPGSVPVTWNVNDTTKLAGQVDLPDVEAGLIMDMLPLRGDMFVYKAGSVTRMRFIGGNSVFDFDTFLETVGVLTQRCVCLGPDGASHVFATNDDIVVHNGASSESILDKRMRRYLFSQIDTTNYTKSFIFTNPLYDEVWFCFPESGQTQPNRALIWNRADNKISEVDGITFRGAAPVQFEGSDGATWETDDAEWNKDNGTWSTAYRRKVLLAAPAGDGVFYLLDDGTKRDGVIFRALLQRTGLSIVGRSRDGKWIEDFKQRKMVTRIWPKVEGININVKVGFQEFPKGPITWGPVQIFKSDRDLWADFSQSGRLLALEYESTKNGDWRLEGYKMELSLEGNF